MKRTKAGFCVSTLVSHLTSVSQRVVDSYSSLSSSARDDTRVNVIELLLEHLGLSASYIPVRRQ